VTANRRERGAGREQTKQEDDAAPRETRGAALTGEPEKPANN